MNVENDFLSCYVPGVTDARDPTLVTPGFTHERRLRAGFVGCGDHSFRNLYPALRYCPVDLVAVCDRDVERASEYQRQFGAGTVVNDHRRLLDMSLDAVFVVTGYEQEGDSMRSTHAALACDFLAAGVATWVEKPPANDLAEIDAIRAALASGGATTYAVGYKKAFTPATRHVVRLMARSEFGTLRSLSVRYPQPMPPTSEMPHSVEARVFLDHLSHPMSLVRALGGPIRAVSRAIAEDGTGFLTLVLVSGAVASLHLGPYSYRPNLAERTEVTGDGACITVENNVRVTWHPHGEIGPYGQAADFTDWGGVIQWEPEFSLGQLYNKGLFLLGYHGELEHFCDAVLADRDVEDGGIAAAEEQLLVFQAVQGPPHQLVELADVKRVPAG